MTKRGKARVDIKAELSALAKPKLTPAQSLSRLMKPAHKSMSRVLGYCLTSDTPEGWRDFSRLAAARLTVPERGRLAFACLQSLHPELATMTAAAALGAQGDPGPAFLGGMDDARSWAAWASRGELKAYALAAFEAMSARDQAAFYQHISTLEVAA